MNCTVCGDPFVIGSDQHSRCREKQSARALAIQRARQSVAAYDRTDEIWHLSDAITDLITALESM